MYGGPICLRVTLAWSMADSLVTSKRSSQPLRCRFDGRAASAPACAPTSHGISGTSPYACACCRRAISLTPGGRTAPACSRAAPSSCCRACGDLKRHPLQMGGARSMLRLGRRDLLQMAVVHAAQTKQHRRQVLGRQLHIDRLLQKARQSPQYRGRSAPRALRRRPVFLAPRLEEKCNTIACGVRGWAQGRHLTRAGVGHSSVRFHCDHGSRTGQSAHTQSDALLSSTEVDARCTYALSWPRPQWRAPASGSGIALGRQLQPRLQGSRQRHRDQATAGRLHGRP